MADEEIPEDPPIENMWETEYVPFASPLVTEPVANELPVDQSSSTPPDES